MQNNLTITKNILIAGIGGQGIILASEILSQALFESGFDVKKSEIHGMSQRGGSVKSEIRFGEKVFSPLIPDSEVDYLLIFNESELERNKIYLRENAVTVQFNQSDNLLIANAKVKNIFLLGKLAYHLPVEKDKWISVIKDMIPPSYVNENISAFNSGFETNIKP